MGLKCCIKTNFGFNGIARATAAEKRLARPTDEQMEALVRARGMPRLFVS